MNDFPPKGILLLAILLLVLPGASPAAEAPTPAAKPNLIVILADDLGYSDLGCYGSEIPTPNLDALAKDGLRFTQFYNTSRCCPSRAAILTGLYSHEAGVGHMIADDKLPGYVGHLNDSCVTLAQVLRPAGYFTAMAGKWHVGGENFRVTPWQRGFERGLVSVRGGFYFADKNAAEKQNGTNGALWLDGRNIPDDSPELPPHWYTTDLYTQYGLKFIDEAVAARKPFFLYLAYNAPHYPLQAPAEDIARFRHGIYTNGWDKLREARYQRQQAAGLIDPAWGLSPRPPEVKAWDTLPAPKQDRFDQIMSVYAACVWHLDQQVGVLVASLRQRGLLDNTLILFLSDNGGNAESGPAGTLNGAQPGGPDSMVKCGESWATLENTPFRLYKHFEHEGGIASPLIVHWPAGIAAKNELRSQPGHIVDIMATLVDVAGAAYPRELNGQAILPLEGRSLKPAFANQPLAARDALFWEHEGNAAVRAGDWKLVRRDSDGAWELYDLKTDRTELHNLAAARPEKARELLAKWDAWAKQTHVVPGPEFHGDYLRQYEKNEPNDD